MAYLPQIPAQYNQDVTPPNPNPDQGAMPVGVSAASGAAAEEPLVVGGDSPPTYSPETLESRSTRFKYGLGDLLQKTKDDIYQNLQDGKEGELRTQAASMIDERKRQATEKLIT